MKLTKIENAAARMGITCGQVIELLTKNVITDGEIIDEEIYIPSQSVDYINKHRDLLFNLQELFGVDTVSCALKVTRDTVNNWVRLKKISADRIYQNKPFFYRETILSLRDSLEKEDSSRLKSRRNKVFKAKNEFYEHYLTAYSPNVENISRLIGIFEKCTSESNAPLLISLVLAECALQVINQRLGLWMCSPADLLKNYLDGKLDLLTMKPLIDDLIISQERACEAVNTYPELFQVEYYYVKNEDLLGCLYLSLTSLSSRKTRGIYYTPQKVVGWLINGFSDCDMLGDGIRYYDPCCGTGNFLINLPEIVPWKKMRGSDIDSVAVSVCRINVFLRSPDIPLKELYSRITVSDYLKDDYVFSGEKDKGDSLCVLGNPPWGVSYDPKEKQKFSGYFESVGPKLCESFALFLERSISITEPGDCISFVLPESILGTACHFPVRRLIAEHGSVVGCRFMGIQFDGVSCPSVILTVRREKPNPDEHMLRCRNAVITAAGKNYVISEDRPFESEFDIGMEDNEYRLLNRILNAEGVTYLKDQADWALGIVTGDNASKLREEKFKRSEPILKGINIDRYRINHKNINYIEFVPEEFQQVAREEFYRAPEKLFYRFINKDLIVAYDSHGMLSLNSANILIPRIPGLNMKYILLLLNSRIARYIYQKKFKATKVLRSHLESIPLVIPTSEQQEKFLELADRLLDSHISSSEEDEIRNDVDLRLAPMYGLDEKEMDMLFELIR